MTEVIWEEAPPGVVRPDDGPIFPADEPIAEPTPEPVADPRPTDPIGAARWDQRAANRAAAERTPVHEIRKPSREEEHYVKDIASMAKRIADVEAEAVRLAPEYEKAEKRYREIVEKMYDYAISAKSRKSWEKKLEAFRPEYARLRDAVANAPDMVKSLRANLDYFQGKLAAFRADPKNVKVVDYAKLRARFPDLIPPGPIQDRLAAYVLGDAKVKAIVDVAAGFEGPEADMAIERSAITRELAAAMKFQADVLDKYVSAGLPIPKPVQAQTDARQVRIDALAADLARVKEAQKDLAEGRRVAIQNVFRVERGVEFRSTGVPPGESTKSGPLAPPSEVTRDRIEHAERWLHEVLAVGDVAAIETRIGEGPGYRAHFNNPDDRMQVATAESASTVIHEYGHAIDYRLQTGDDSVVQRSLDFLRYRVGDEPAVDLKEKFGRGDAGEMGRKDKFDAAFDDYSAHYVGKDYGRDATEIISMGIEQLYNNPASFAKNDSEYFKFVVGILDGSLR